MSDKLSILTYGAAKNAGGSGGQGDMTKAVYDSNDDGVVDAADNASKVNNHTVNSDVPSGAVFTDTQMIKTEYTLSYNSWETGTGDYLGYYIYEIETNPRLNGDYPVNVYLSSGQASDFMPTAEEVEAFNDSIVGGDMFSSDMGDYTKITLIAWQRPVDRSQTPKNLKVFIEGVKY